MSNSDFRDKIASIMMDIPVEEVVLNRNLRLERAREKWVAKHFGASHIKRKTNKKGTDR